MKMLSDVREFVEQLPFAVEERQVDHCIYFGEGTVCTGEIVFPTSVRIVRNDSGKIFVELVSKKAGIRETDIPFSTLAHRKSAPDLVRLTLKKFFN